MVISTRCTNKAENLQIIMKDLTAINIYGLIIKQ